MLNFPYRKWLLVNHKLEFIAKKAKNSKRAQTILRRVTISGKTLLVDRKNVPQLEVSIFDERRKTLVNEKENLE